MAFNKIITDSAPWTKYSQQAKENATEIYGVLYNSYGWTLNAVCGALGSMSNESYLNPGQYELGHGTPTNPWGYGYGVGLIQFTSPDVSNYPNPWLYWCQQNNVAIDDGYEQLRLCDNAEDPAYQSMGLSEGIWGWLTTSQYPMHLSEYKVSTLAPSYLAQVWFHNLERPPAGDTTESQRMTDANYWYQYLSGQDPPDPGPGPGPGPHPTPTGSKKMPLWFYLKHPYRRF